MEAYFSLAMKSIFVENILLAYFLGMCSFLACSKKVETATGLGLAVIFVLTVTAPLNWALNEFLLKDTGLLGVDLQFLSFIVFIATIAATVQLVEMVLDKFFPPLYSALGIFLPLITTNCAILGLALFSTNKGYGLLEGLSYALGAGGGLTQALVIMAGIREETRVLDIPKLIEGTALNLIIAGILSMAFMGFAGLFSTS